MKRMFYDLASSINQLPTYKETRGILSIIEEHPDGSYSINESLVDELNPLEKYQDFLRAFGILVNKLDGEFLKKEEYDIESILVRLNLKDSTYSSYETLDFVLGFCENGVYHPDEKPSVVLITPNSGERNVIESTRLLEWFEMIFDNLPSRYKEYLTSASNRIK